jgi:DNA-binding NarL/FixJ family response regulator
VRITALDTGGADGGPPTTVLLISPAGDLDGLTPRELEVLGYLVDGAGNAEIAEALVVAQRTVATHVEHILLKLGTPTRTLAAVRAERYGQYVPVGCPPPGPELSWRH